MKQHAASAILVLVLAMISSCNQQLINENTSTDRIIKPGSPRIDSRLIRDFENKIVEALFAREAENQLAQASKAALNKRESLETQILRLAQLLKRLDDVNHTLLSDSNKIAIKGLRYKISHLKYELVESRLTTTAQIGSKLTGLLRHYTTQNKTPETFLKRAYETLRVNSLEIKALARKLDNQANSANLYQMLGTDEALFLTNSSADKHLYLNLISDLLSSMPLKFSALLPHFEGAPIEVHALPLSAETAEQFIYTPPLSSPGTPAINSSSVRPLSKQTSSILQINMKNMRKHPLYEVEAKTFIYGIPGMHLLATSPPLLSSDITAEFTLSEVPAFTFGWGLYVAQLAREHGLYRSHYGELGSLIIENRYAAMLIADLRLFQKTWNTEQAISFLQQEGFMNIQDAKSIIDLAHSSPVSQTSAFAGLLAFLDLKAEAEQTLGQKFNLPRFHRQILSTGPLPLPFVEEEVSAWLNRNH